MDALEPAPVQPPRGRPAGVRAFPRVGQPPRGRTRRTRRGGGLGRARGGGLGRALGGVTAVALASVASSAQAAGLAVTASAHGTLASAAGAWGHVAAVLQATRVGVDAAVVGVRVLLEGEAAACTTTPHATALGFGFLALVACVLIAVGRMRHGTEQRRLDLARHMVELGQAPPAELLAGPVRNDLRRGIVLVFAGLGLGLTAGVTGDAGLAPGGLIPGFIGLGYLVSYYLAGGRLAAPGRSFASGGSPPVGSGPHVREGGPS